MSPTISVAEDSNPEQPKKTAKKKFSFHISGVSTVDLLFFVQNLEVMLRTGFSVADALAVLAPQMRKKAMRTAVSDIQASVERGRTLAESLEAFPHIFSQLFIHMVEAGEASGKLDVTLKEITLNLKKSYVLRKKIINALIYPSIILVAMIAVGTGMVLFVLPKVLALFSTGDFDIPLPTRILLFISEFADNHGVLLGLVILSAVIVFIVSLRIASGKRFWQAVVLRLPIVSKIIIEIQLARFYRTLSSLLSTDIPIIDSFKILYDLQTFFQYKDIVYGAAEHLQKGRTIHESLDQNPRLFPPQTVQMMRIGEESGTLDEICKEVADFYESEVDNAMSNLTVIIEPVLMLLLGIGVGFIAVSIIMPIYSLVNQI